MTECNTCGGSRRWMTTFEERPEELVDIGPCPDCAPDIASGVRLHVFECRTFGDQCVTPWSHVREVCNDLGCELPHAILKLEPTDPEPTENVMLTTRYLNVHGRAAGA